MITSADVLKIDQTFVHKAYEEWPQHFRKASKIAAKADHGSGYYSSLIFCGVGGSGTSCDILHEMTKGSSGIPSTVLKGERMPEFVDKRSLVIVNSVSGNTSEAISMMKAGAEKGSEVICISSGGTMEEEAGKRGLQHINIPNLSLPRASLPYLLMPGLKVLNSLLEKPISGFHTVHNSLEDIAKRVCLAVPYDDNAAKQIASFMEGGMAFCFTSPTLISAGTRFKNSLNENSKLHCLRESVMEASHNEIVPFTFANGLKSKVLLLGWKQDSVQVNERFNKFKLLFKQIGQPFMQIVSDQKTLLNAIVSSIYILDYASIYIAIARRIDPSPTPAIDILKGRGQ